MADARGRKRKAEKWVEFYHIRAKGQFLKVPKSVVTSISEDREGRDPLHKKKKKLSRRNKRKLIRAQKKARKVAFFSKNGDQNCKTPTDSVAQKRKQHPLELRTRYEPDAKPISVEKKKKRKKRKRRESSKSQDTCLQKVIEDNKEEDKEIKRLEKLLKLNSKNQVPSKFRTDGLDYLLEICDPLSIETSDRENKSDDGMVSNSKARLSAMKVRKNKNDAEHLEMSFHGEELNDESTGEDKMEGNDYSDGNIGQAVIAGHAIKTICTNNQGHGKGTQDRDDDKGNDDDDDEDEDDINDDVYDNEYDDDDDGDNEYDDGDDDDDDDNDDDDDDDDDGDGGDGDNDYSDDGGDDNGILKSEPDKEVHKHDSNRIRDSENDSESTTPGCPQSKTLQKYIPPHMRRQSSAEALNRTRRQMKGLLNRLSEGNLSVISSEVENLFTHNSRNDMNRILSDVILDSCVTVSLMPDKLLMENVLLVAILSSHIGIEVGAFFVERLAERFDNLHRDGKEDYGQGKECLNVVSLFAHLYNFKIIHCCLIYDIIRRLASSFTAQDVELLLLLLKNTGAEIRRDDPASLKDIILQIQAKAASATGLTSDSRVRFMLEIISNLRNNNLRKIPGYDPSQVEHLRKLLRSVMRESGQGVNNQLKINLEDLLNAETKGRWWIVGSAWSGKLADSTGGSVDCAPHLENCKLLELARKQRMNTDVRKNVFVVIMTSEDYIDAFEKLLRLNLKDVQAREIVHVLIDCCLQEKTFNPYYAYVGQKFCEYNRSYQVTFQYSFWDKFKVLSDLSSYSLTNLSLLICHLVATRALSLAILKVVDFVDLDKPSVRLFTQLFRHILVDYSLAIVRNVFERISTVQDLGTLRQSLRIFIKHFVGKTKSSKGSNKDIKDLQERLKLADDILGASDGVKL